MFPEAAQRWCGGQAVGGLWSSRLKWGAPGRVPGRGRLTWSDEGRARMTRKVTHCTRTWERCKALRAADDSKDAGLREGVWERTGLKWLRRGKGSEETLRCPAARDLAVKRSLCRLSTATHGHLGKFSMQ